MRGRFFLVLFVGLALWLPGSLQAQITCTGDGCAYLPYSPSTLDSSFAELKRQYTDPLFNDMGQAMALAASAGPPIGTVNLSGITAGVHLGVGYVPVEKVTVSIPGFGTYNDVPRAGGALSPRAFVGVNAGALFLSSYDIASGTSTPAMLSPARFDLYFTALERTETVKQTAESKGDLTAQVYARGFEIRYHLVEGNNILLGPLLRFRGVSIGAGSYHTRQAVDYRQEKSKLTYRPSGSDELTWEAENRISYRASIDSYPVEIRTGVQLLYLLNLTIAAGTVWSKGSSEFELNRVGPVYLKSDLASQMGYTIPGAVLSAHITGKGDVPPVLPFARVGVEFNLTVLKISFEYMVAKKAYGGNIGVRVEI